MTQKLKIHQDSTHPHDALWWTPLFDLQKDLAKNIQESFSKLAGETPVPTTFEGQQNWLDDFQHQTHRMFSEIFNTRQMASQWLGGSNTEPYVNLVENEQGFKVIADVPGVRAEDVDISIADNALTITGERTSDHLQKGDQYIRRECHCGLFSRTIALPESADMSKAEASFDDHSVLTIAVPKKAEKLSKSKTTKIAVKAKKLAAKKTSKAKASPQPKSKSTTREPLESAKKKEEFTPKTPNYFADKGVQKQSPAKAESTAA